MDQPKLDEILTSTTPVASGSIIFSTNNLIPQSSIPVYTLNKRNANLSFYSKMYCPRKRTVTSNCRMRPYYIPEKRIRTKSENNIEPNNSLYLEIISSLVNNPAAPTAASMLIDNHDPMDTQSINNANNQTTPAKPLKKAKSLEAINKASSVLKKPETRAMTEKNFHEMEFVLTSRIQNMKVQE